MAPNPVREKSYRFALSILRLGKILRARREEMLRRQVVRAGTSIGANVEEAIAGQSHRDFTAKMAIACKEAREPHYWLRLIRDGEIVEANVVEPLIADCDELVRLLTAIVKSAQSH